MALVAPGVAFAEVAAVKVSVPQGHRHRDAGLAAGVAADAEAGRLLGNVDGVVPGDRGHVQGERATDGGSHVGIGGVRRGICVSHGQFDGVGANIRYCGCAKEETSRRIERQPRWQGGVIV